MANTIAIAIGVDAAREKRVTRLGRYYSIGEANTYQTFARVVTYKDGSGNCSIKQNGNIIHEFNWGAETVKKP